MRFRRSILASLAPLIGLSALLAAASAEAGVTRAASPLIRLLQSRLFQSRLFMSGAQLSAPPCDFAAATPSHERPPARALLAFTALAVTPLGHSVWMVARRPSIQLSARRPLPVPLRC
jgi:drug/metabolite transporter (DMT)-like permease